MTERMTDSFITSERFGSRGVPRYVSRQWLSVSKAPEMTCRIGTVFV